MSGPVRVLFVGVSAAQTERFGGLLRQAGCAVLIESAETVDRLALLLEKARWDIVVAAGRFPGGEWRNVLTLMKQRHSDVPCLIVEGEPGEERAIAAIKSGASDYIVRGRNARFAPAVLHAVDEARQNRGRHRAGRELRAAVAMAGRDRASEESIIAAIGDGIAIQDTDMRIVYQNDAHRRLVGDHVGSRCYHAYDRGDGVCSGCHMAAVLQGKESGPVRHCFGRDARQVTLEVAAFPLRDQQGKVIGGIEVVRDIGGRSVALVEEAHLFIRDNLTGVYNHAFFVAEAERFGKSRHFPLSVVMVDIDGLGEINRTFGKGAGDQVLRSMARLLTTVFRVEDIVARVGGDGFAVLLPRAGEEGVSAAIDRFRQSLVGDPICVGDVKVGVSIGIATEPTRGDLQPALHSAEVRLYEDMAARGRVLLPTG